MAKVPHYIPGSFLVSEWNQLLLHMASFSSHLETVERAFRESAAFRRVLQIDILCQGRDLTPANEAFLLEELLILHALRQELIELPHHVSNGKGWRLVAYPGHTLLADVFLWQTQLLPRSRTPSGFAHGFYDWSEARWLDFERCRPVLDFLRERDQLPGAAPVPEPAATTDGRA